MRIYVITNKVLEYYIVIVPFVQNVSSSQIIPKIQTGSTVTYKYDFLMKEQKQEMVLDLVTY